MHSLRDLLAGLPLPPALSTAGSGAEGYWMPSAHLLGGDLPQGHLHVWSGPPGAGKTAFLLGLLLDGARRGRGTCLASYDLPASALAMRVLSMESNVPLVEIDGGGLSADAALAVARARARLESLPFFVLEARGLTVDSLADRCVRSSRRIDVLGVDFVEAVVRPTELPVSAVLHDLAALAQHRWLAVVAVARTSPVAAPAPDTAAADRVGWIAPDGGRGDVEATLLENRHGARHTCRLHLDPERGRWTPPA
jgi:hypothetical protein